MMLLIWAWMCCMTSALLLAFDQTPQERRRSSDRYFKFAVVGLVAWVAITGLGWFS